MSVTQKTQRLSYGLNFSVTMDPFEHMDPLERATMVAQCTKKQRGVDIELFIYLCMPRVFAYSFEEYRRHYTVKESFRRTMLKECHVKTPHIAAVAKVLAHIKSVGSFRLSDLASVLGHEPTSTELTEVQGFLSTQSDADLKTLLNGSSLHGEGNSSPLA